jgi:uncharacterized phage-associated protein
MYSALDIANYVLGYYCEKSVSGISNLKLQKILYFLQAEFLVSKRKPLFKEDIEALDFGPVVHEVNKRFQIYGGAKIPYNLIDPKKNYKSRISNRDKETINNMLDVLDHYSSTALLNIIHRQKPWHDSYFMNGHEKCVIRNGEMNWIKVISNQQLYDFFSED